MARKETELGYSALLGCWKSLMCLLQGSGLLLSPWAGHLWNQTGPAGHRNTSERPEARGCCHTRRLSLAMLHTAVTELPHVSCPAASLNPGAPELVCCWPRQMDNSPPCCF